MAKVRCPMCSKPNPDDFVFCESCGARIKPLVVPESPDSTPPREEGGITLPDWLDLDPQDSPASTDPTKPDPDDWLERLRVESDPELDPQSAQKVLGADPLEWRQLKDTSDLDLLDSLEPDESDKTYDDSEDWLNRLSEEPETEPETQPKPEKADVEHEPTVMETGDWLEHIRSLHKAETETDEAASKAAPKPEPTQESVGIESGTGEEPEWLGRLTVIQAPEVPEGESAQVGEAPVPDWIDKGLDAEKSMDELLSEDHPLPYDESIVQSVQSLPETQEAPPESQAEPEPEPLDLPDESDAAAEDSMGDLPSISVPIVEIPEPRSEAETGPEEGGDLDSWISDLDDDSGLKSETGAGGLPTGQGEDIPGWLTNLSSVVTGSVDEETTPDIDDGAISPFITEPKFDDDILNVDNLPQWLKPETGSAVPVDEPSDSGLPAAQLPGWLDAIRPSGDTPQKAPGADKSTEGTGPLAGLSNILPAEPEIVDFKKPPTYSSKLQVTPTQQKQAEIFKELLSREGEVEPIPEPPLVSSQRVLRWLIAVILILTIGYVVIAGNPITPTQNNTLIPGSTYSASKIINSLPSQAPVLIGFEYNPGTNGEMQAAAASLVDHLILKSARLTMVSTLPTGPAVAENFIQSTQGHYGLESGADYINLGFVPGGAAGLLSFAQTPKFIFPISYTGIDPWETPILDGINTIKDFALVVVITSDPDTARTWIEQVQPKMDNTPLLAVVSAQAEPMVRPYFGSETGAQVQGIVSGISGGTAYEVAVGGSNLGSRYWGAFSYGLFLAVSAILIGGAYHLINWVLEKTKYRFGGGA